MRAGLSRKQSGIKAPKAYADSGDIANAADKDHAKAMYLFNCKQRAHYNYMEMLPATALSMLISGLVYPRTATLLGIGWIFGRIVYALGYTRADKENGSGRFVGFALSQPLAIGLWGLAAWTGIQMTL